MPEVQYGVLDTSVGVFNPFTDRVILRMACDFTSSALDIFRAYHPVYIPPREASWLELRRGATPVLPNARPRQPNMSGELLTTSLANVQRDEKGEGEQTRS